MHIKAFWKEKEHYDRNKDKKRFPKLTVHEWMYQYLTSKVGKNHASICELAYNLLDAALHYMYDADCELWLKVMRGEYDEAIYWDEHRMVEGLMMLLQKLDKQGNSGRVTGKLHKDLLIKSIRKYFVLKTDVRFNKLKRALGKEEAAAGAFISYIHLFKEDKDGNQGPFAEGIRDQHVEEREEYLNDIETALCDVQMPGERGQGPIVALEGCLKILSEVDPNKPTMEAEQYIRRGFNLKKSAPMDPQLKLEASEFLDNLANGVVTTSTKRDSLIVE